MIIVRGLYHGTVTVVVEALHSDVTVSTDHAVSYPDDLSCLTLDFRRFLEKQIEFTHLRYDDSATVMQNECNAAFLIPYFLCRTYLLCVSVCSVRAVDAIFSILSILPVLSVINRYRSSFYKTVTGTTDVM